MPKNPIATSAAMNSERGGAGGGSRQEGRRQGYLDSAERARQKDIARAEDDTALDLDLDLNHPVRERLRRENGGWIAAIVRGSRILRPRSRDGATR